MAKENEKEKGKDPKQQKQEEPKEKDKKAKEEPKKPDKPKDQKDAKDGKDEKKEGKETKPGKSEGEAAAPANGSALKNILNKGIGGISIVILALVVLNLIIMGSLLYYMYYMKFVYQRPIVTEKSAKEEIDEKKDATAEIIEYKLDPFTINLSKAKGKRYVSAKFVLIAIDWDTRDELDKKVDKIRDAIIRVLDDKYPEELITVQGKLFLKDQIVTEVNRILTKGSIKEVFIESFLIQ